MNRVLRSLLISAILLIALLAGVVPASDTPALPRAAAQDLIASLDPVNGLVLHQTPDGDPHDLASWTVVREPVLVGEGDRVRTGPDGMAYLTFFEGIESEIRPDSYVVVSTLDLPDDDAGAVQITLDQLAGLTLVTIETTLDAEDRFELHTPGATVVVRGTAWWTLVTGTGQSQFLLERGIVGVLPELDPETRSGTADYGDLLDQQLFAFTDQDRFAELGANGGPLSAPLGEDVIASAIEARPDAPLVPATCGDGTCQAGEVPSCLVDCINEINLAQCSNGVCEPEANENLITCPNDCGAFRGVECGNGTCDQDESALTCPQDCTAGEYFEPPYPGACGNGDCEIGETALSCAADCATGGSAPPPVSGDTPPDNTSAAPGDQCIATAESANLRGGPGVAYAVTGYLVTGDQLVITGQNAAGDWLYNAARDAWVARFVVTISGPCDSLAVQAAPPLPAVPAVVVPPAQPGQPAVVDGGTTVDTPNAGGWGGCGSCRTCGDHPAGECVTTPTGECVWDPATCAVVGPPSAAEPYLVVPNSVTCSSLDQFYVPVELVTPDGATIDDHTASSALSNALVQTTFLIDASHYKIELYCIGSPLTSDTITAKVWDTAGRVVTASFTVNIN